MLRQPVTLIFDIGKTNKKALFFDESFRVILEETKYFEEITDNEGFPCEDITAVTKWILSFINDQFNQPTYYIRAINFCAYGASLVHLNENGQVLLPLVNYLKPFPSNLKELFIRQYDSLNTLQLSTASPYLGMLNSGLQLYALKYEQPTTFLKIKTSLHLPQYFSYCVTQKRYSDITSIGCHSMLWNFSENTYHYWVLKESLLPLLAPLHLSTHTVGLIRANQPLTVGIGVHDSSSALFPYLLTEKNPFLLLSTGTWNICFNPFNQTPLTQEELARDCLCYINPLGKSVKASRIFLGNEHEAQVKLLSSFFNLQENYFTEVSFDESIYQALISKPAEDIRFYPISLAGTGPIPEIQSKQTAYSSFVSFEVAYHQLVRYLVQWQKISIDLVDPQHVIEKIILVGGFGKSEIFLEILKREIPDRKFFTSDHPQTSALGAALLVNKPQSYANQSNVVKIKAL